MHEVTATNKIHKPIGFIEHLLVVTLRTLDFSILFNLLKTLCDSLYDHLEL